MTEQPTEDIATGPTRPKTPKPAGKTKSDDLRKLLLRRNGASVAQVQQRLGWQPHTVRAAISRLRSSGLPIDLDRSGKVARYRVMSGDEQ